MKQISLNIDGNDVFAFEGETILDVAKRNMIEIPTLCHDKRLKPFSSCFICVVKVEGMRGLQPSCSTKVSNNMIVTTQSDEIRKSRKTALELMVSNHYADCVAPCTTTCPAGVDVQGYIALIDKGMYTDAIKLIKEKNPLPAICGRVCVRPCEAACRRTLIDENGVGIDYLKRFAADIDLQYNGGYKGKNSHESGKKVAIIGAGPAGLSSAYYLRENGHTVDIFDAHPHGGGMLRYGIPEYRLPNKLLDLEIKTIENMGVNIHYNKKLGRDILYKNLKKDYDSIILAIGSQGGTKLRCENDDAEGVLSGIDYLMKMELSGEKFNFKGKTVAVVGGGNTAMDCCRSAMRCGAKKVYIIYRRTESEMPANKIEIHESKLEGVEYLFLTNPIKVNINENGRMESLKLIKMELGEPDSSGRRRPIPVEGSEYDLKLDFVLAAIGQKTVVDFESDINDHLENDKFELNRWGNISADPKTLQTNVESIFSAGDGVTGPATLIEAIFQGRLAADSCNKYLSGEKPTGLKEKFYSRKDNFDYDLKKDVGSSFIGKIRNEMPVLAPEKRLNFNEVELGYDLETAHDETQRCLECGCNELFICDLKKYCDEYGAEQKKFVGSFKRYEVDHSHPLIEIDNNKCILCGKCVRVCNEVVGANALGFVRRGFETFIAPSMGKELQNTNCDSCGLCIDICPTGAIGENTTFKPGPFKNESIKTICNYCSVGCEISLHHRGYFFNSCTGAEGEINQDKNICKYPKFGYEYLNSPKRITTPLLKNSEGKFEPISFEKAYSIITETIKDPHEDFFFGGGSNSNENLYLFQKLARFGAKTPNISSFHYMGKDKALGYRYNSFNNSSFDEIEEAGKIYIFGGSIQESNPVVWYKINNARFNGTKVIYIDEKVDNKLSKRVDKTIEVKSLYKFIKALNFLTVKENLTNGLFLEKYPEFDSYKNELLKENISFDSIGIDYKDALSFLKEYNNENNAISVSSELHLSSESSRELLNLNILTGKLGKSSSGVITLKADPNSQGIFDMGVTYDMGVGYKDIDSKEYIESVKSKFGIDIPKKDGDLIEKFGNSERRNIYILNEDPIKNDELKLKAQDKLIVWETFFTDTAMNAFLIMPASFHMETGGSFTNTQRYLNTFVTTLPSDIEEKFLDQMVKIMDILGVKNSYNISADILMEAISLLDKEYIESIRVGLKNTQKDSNIKITMSGSSSIKEIVREKFKSLGV